MDTQELITIIHAAQLSGKSIQTIRRMIKQKKIKVRKQKTPQGFNYLVIRESLAEFMNDVKNKTYIFDQNGFEAQEAGYSTQQNQAPTQPQTQNQTTNQPTQSTIQNSIEAESTSTREHRSITQDAFEDFKNEVAKFNLTIQQLNEQSARDKANFFELIKTFQDRVIILENQIKQLEAPKPSKWKFWK